MSAELAACVDFLQRLIRTPGLPGHEGDTAELMRAEMVALGYSDVHVDAVGNVLGRVPGSGNAPAVLFNTHLDHVDVGDHDRWPHPPYGGEIHDDKVWGRGAVDIKGPLAAQVYGVGRLLQDTAAPSADLWVTAVVQEEIGGVGARHLLENVDTPIVVVGEPSGNTLRRGHRGRCELVVHIQGRSVHASVPHNGVNPYEVLAAFVQRLAHLDMASHPDLGTSTVAPTLIRTDQTSANVIPGELWLTCDWRQVAGESAADARRKLQQVLDASLIEGSSGRVHVPLYDRIAYTGARVKIAGDNPPYILAADHPAVRAASEILTPLLGPMAPAGIWQFATDGGHFAQAGMACVGFGPGDEMLAHTVNEHIPIDQLAIALDANALLARQLSSTTASLAHA